MVYIVYRTTLLYSVLHCKMEQSIIDDSHREKTYFDNYTMIWSVLSNFYPSKFMIDGKEYYHVEGYYQSQKFSNTNKDIEEHVRSTMDPKICKRIARSHILSGNELRVWENGRKDRVMKRALLCKFLSNSELLDVLLSSGDNILIESSRWDYYWACGQDDSGKNKLGELLMEVRELLSDTKCT